MPFPPPGRFDSAALRRTREATGLSRPQLAARIGVNVALIKSWEAKGVCPSVGNITRVAQGLGLKVSDLYTPDAASAGSLRDLRGRWPDTTGTRPTTQSPPAARIHVGTEQDTPNFG